MNWADKAFREIENELEAGNITQKEYDQQLRELREEVRDNGCTCFDDDN